jgi:hypothetical protein
MANRVFETLYVLRLNFTASADAGRIPADARPKPSSPDSFKNDLRFRVKSVSNAAFFLFIFSFHCKFQEIFPYTFIESGNW